MKRIEVEILRALARRDDWAESRFLADHVDRLVEDGLVEMRDGSQSETKELRITTKGRKRLQKRCVIVPTHPSNPYDLSRRKGPFGRN